MTEKGESKGRRLTSKFYRHPTKTGGFEVLCVVTNGKYVYHHLDEQKPKNWQYTNIIPIRDELNSAIQNRSNSSLPLELDHRVLAAKSSQHWSKGSFPQGYACSRLGAFLMMPHRNDVILEFGRDPDKSLDFCVNALINLRPISAIPFAIDTMHRNVRPILHSDDRFKEVSQLTKAKLVIEIGSYFRDFGDPKTSLRCCDLAEYLSQSMETKDAKKLHARIYQHRGIAFLALGDYLNSRIWLEKARNKLVDSGYKLGEAHDNLWIARLCLQDKKGDVDLVKNHIKKIYDAEDNGIVTAWTMAEALWTDADANLTRSYNKKKSMDIVNRAIKCYMETGIIPTSVCSPKSLIKYYEKYPRDAEFYIAPRNISDLGRFVPQSLNALEIISKQ